MKIEAASEQSWFCCADGLAGAPRARSRSTPPRAAGTVQATATAVLVDVVVRDKRGQPVTDLTAADFESLRRRRGRRRSARSRCTRRTSGVKRAPSTAGTGSTAAGDSGPGRQARSAEAPPEPVVALVFDRLTPEARVFAHKAALGYVGQSSAEPVR